MEARRAVAVLTAAVVSCLLATTLAVELTFELPDNARECFYEEILKNTTASLEFQVSIADAGTPPPCTACKRQIITLTVHPRLKHVTRIRVSIYLCRNVSGCHRRAV